MPEAVIHPEGYRLTANARPRQVELVKSVLPPGSKKGDP